MESVSDGEVILNFKEIFEIFLNVGWWHQMALTFLMMMAGRSVEFMPNSFTSFLILLILGRFHLFNDLPILTNLTG